MRDNQRSTIGWNKIQNCTLINLKNWFNELIECLQRGAKTIGHNDGDSKTQGNSSRGREGGGEERGKISGYWIN